MDWCEDMATGATGARPLALRVAAAAQAGEAVGLAIAGVFAAMATAAGKSYQLGSGIALTMITFGTAAGLVAFVVGLDRARPWSRTPVVMVQLFVIIAGFTLLEGHRPAWGVPALLLAVACLAGLFTPASLRALNRPRPPQAAPQAPSAKPTSAKPTSARAASDKPTSARAASDKPAAPSQPANRPSAKSQSAKSQPAKRQPAARQPAKKPAK
jgi:hypothetical protein